MTKNVYLVLSTSDKNTAILTVDLGTQNARVAAYKPRCGKFIEVLLKAESKKAIYAGITVKDHLTTVGMNLHGLQHPEMFYY